MHYKLLLSTTKTTNCFLSISALQQRVNLTISLEFATEQSNAVLLYNGRYSERKDFIAVHLIDGQASFTISLGDEPTTVRSYVPGGLADGQWHKVQVHYGDKVHFLFYCHSDQF